MYEKILLVDGNSIVNRAYYALPLLTNDEGIFTNGIFGFFNMLFRFIDEEEPDYIGIAFDLPAPTFRHEKYAEYKGTRKGMPNELAMQMPILKNILMKMNIEIFEQEGFEADDVLGTLAIIAEAENLDVTILSGDKDLLQLATDRIKIKIPKTSKGQTTVEEYRAKDVLEKIGVTPKEFIDVKGLMGDSSDNIKGVPGIGEKTALKIIKEFKTVENAINNYEKVKPKRASENLNIYKDQAILSKELATIITDVPMEFDLEKTKNKDIYTTEALEELDKLNIKTFRNRFSKSVNEIMEKRNTNYLLVEDDFNKVKEISENLLTKKLVVFGVINVEGSVIGISFSYEKDQGIFITFNEITKSIILGGLKDFFESDIEKISLDSKFDKVYLARNNIDVKNIIFDGALGGYVINSSKSTYFYNDISFDFLKEHHKSWEDVFGKGKSQKHFTQIDKKDLANFGAAHTDVMFRAYPVMLEIIKENDFEDLYFNIELPLVDVLKDMELSGIKIHKEKLLEYQSMLEGKLEVLTNNIYKHAGEEFNINSPQQLGNILFEKLQLPNGKKTKTGYSTGHSVLIKLVNTHDIIEEVLEYRTLSKLKSTYADGLLNVLNKKDSKIYSTFNQLITTTGRISSTEPNLQNIPIKMEIGRELRKVFIPSCDEYVFLDGDYSQIELRVLAHMSGDETLINAFRNDEDIHRLTASQVFKVSYDEVQDYQRSNAKAVNFGIIYGISPFSLGQDLKITRKEAEQYIRGYFEKYPKIKEYLDNTVKEAKENGYSKTIFNRRRSIPEINSSNYNVRGFGERVAMNMPIQGTAADIIKIAMIRVYNRIKEDKLDAKLILQVHDELLLEVNKNHIDEIEKIIKYEMENAVELLVPIDTDITVGENWYDTK